MTDIHVMGLPKSIKKPKLINLFRTVIFGKKLKCKFWIRESFPLPNSKFQQVVVNISKANDAYKATDLINDFIYFNGKEDFQLSSVIVHDHLPTAQYDDPMQEEVYAENPVTRERESRQNSRHKPSEMRNKERSRSPHYKQESSKLDMEIDLVRKQRLLVEEERKLLLEKKKLELLKEFGPNTVKDFEKYAAAVEKHTLEATELPKPQITVPKKNKTRQNKEGLPLFVLPCRIILKGMREVIAKHTNDDDNFELKKSLRLAIRKRIAEMLLNKSFMTSGEIIQLYRVTYPEDTDEKFMLQLAAELKENVNVAEEKLKATESSDNAQDKTEAKLLTGDSSSTNIGEKESKVELVKEISNTEVNVVKQEMKKEVNDSARTIDLEGETKSEEALKDTDIKVSLDDMCTELDDWLEDDTNVEQANGTNIEPGGDCIKESRAKGDADGLKLNDEATKEEKRKQKYQKKRRTLRKKVFQVCFYLRLLCAMKLNKDTFKFHLNFYYTQVATVD